MTRVALLLSLLGLCGCNDVPVYMPRNAARDAASAGDAASETRPDAPAGAQAIALRFAGRVGAEPFRCGGRYAGIGTTGSTLEGLDFRLYVSNVRLLTASGAEVPLTLDAGDYQTANVAMLDFEDGTGACQDGNSGMNDVVRGSAPAGVYTGVRFELGIPFELNHADAALASSPLTFTSMYWGWQAGYKFLRMDAKSTGLPDGMIVHLGSTGCLGGPPAGVTSCAQPNRPSVTLDGFDPATRTIVADLAALLSGSNIDVNATGPSLCMAGPSDTDCAPIMERLGLGSGPQSFFRVE